MLRYFAIVALQTEFSKLSGLSVRHINLGMHIEQNFAANVMMLSMTCFEQTAQSRIHCAATGKIESRLHRFTFPLIVYNLHQSAVLEK